MSINFGDIEKIIQSHMKDQPHVCKCADCGSDVETEITEVESDGDLHLLVHPCHCAED